MIYILLILILLAILAPTFVRSILSIAGFLISAFILFSIFFAERPGAELTDNPNVPQTLLMDTPGCKTQEQLVIAQATISKKGREAGMLDVLPECLFFWKGEFVIVSVRSGGDARITVEGVEPDVIEPRWIPKEAVR